MKTTLLVPVLNEIGGMRAIMPAVERLNLEQILIIDGQSTDGTAEWSREQGYDVITQSKRGLINAYREAFPHIRGDFILTFSPDGNSPVEAIPRLIKKIEEGFDLVIASRYIGGARSDDDTPFTRFGNWCFTTAINLLFGGRYSDAMVIFRIYKRESIERLGLDRDWPPLLGQYLASRVGYEPVISMRAARAGFRIADIPVDEPKRIAGEGKCHHVSWGSLYLLQMALEALRPSSTYRS